MRAIIKQPGQPAAEIEIPNTLDALQKAVGGYIEIVHVQGLPGVLIVNEEGKIRDLEPNLVLPWPSFDVLVGPVLYLGEDLDEGELTDAPLSLEAFREWAAPRELRTI